MAIAGFVEVDVERRVVRGRGAGGDDDREDGGDARPTDGFLDGPADTGAGDPARLVKTELDMSLLPAGGDDDLPAAADAEAAADAPDVAACRNVGGAVASILAFARLAAIAAATDDFFAAGVVIGVIPLVPGRGLAFASCFLAVSSSSAISLAACGGQTSS